MIILTFSGPPKVVVYLYNVDSDSVRSWGSPVDVLVHRWDGLPRVTTREGISGPGTTSPRSTSVPDQMGPKTFYSTTSGDTGVSVGGVPLGKNGL